MHIVYQKFAKMPKIEGKKIPPDAKIVIIPYEGNVIIYNIFLIKMIII